MVLVIRLTTRSAQRRLRRAASGRRVSVDPSLLDEWSDLDLYVDVDNTLEIAAIST